MAIIKCPECQYEVSDKAVACPKCGYPIAKEAETAQQQTKERKSTYTAEDVKEKTVYIAEKDSKGICIASAMLIGIFIVALMINVWIGLFILPYIIIIEIASAVTYAGQKDLYFTNKKVVGRRGIIAQKLLDSPLDKINNISVTSTPLGKNIEITTSSDKHTFYYIANANEFREKLLKEIDIYKDLQIKRYADFMRH